MLSRFIAFAKDYVSRKKGVTKNELAEVLADEFGLEKRQSVYTCRDFSVRFSKAIGKSFSNTVISLSTLKKYDDKPFLSCIVRPTNVEFLLANSTLLKRISHSSHRLRVNKICGSFNGNDILRSLGGVSNKPENFPRLFELHQQFSWKENLYRLVERTNQIVPQRSRIELTGEQIKKILGSVDLARILSIRPDYAEVGVLLNNVVQKHCREILEAAKTDNIKVRGDTIEKIITEEKFLHSLENMSHILEDNTLVLIDIKSKLIHLASCPKGYNIDKVLRHLAADNSVMSYLFVGIDLSRQKVSACLVSIVDRTIIDRTRIQFHWAGRSSRGVTQLTGDLNDLFSSKFKEHIDVSVGKKFLQRLIEL